MLLIVIMMQQKVKSDCKTDYFLIGFVIMLKRNANFSDYAQDAPRYQTNSWDAGYAQIAKLAFGNERVNDEFLGFK